EAGTLEGALRRCVREISDHTGWPVGHVYVVSFTGTELVSSGLWHVDDGDRFAELRRLTEAGPVPRGQETAGRVLDTGGPEWVEDLTKEAAIERTKAAVQAGLRTAVAFPVLVGREVVAVLEFFSP